MTLVSSLVRLRYWVTDPGQRWTDSTGGGCFVASVRGGRTVVTGNDLTVGVPQDYRVAVEIPDVAAAVLKGFGRLMAGFYGV